MSRNPFIRFAPYVVVLCLVLGGLGALRHVQMQVQTDPEEMLESDVGLLTTFKLVEAALERASILLISMECDDVFTHGNLRAMYDIGEQFRRDPGVIDIKSFTHSVIPYRDGFSLKYRDYLPNPLTPQALNEVRTFSVTHPLVRNLLVSEDGRHGMIIVTYGAQHFADVKQRAGFHAYVDSVLEPYIGDARSFRTLSVPQVQEDITQTITGDVRTFSIAAAAFLLVGCLVYFRTFRMMAYVALMLGGYLALLQTLLSLVGVRVSFVSIAFFPLLIGIQLMLLAHVCRTFRLHLDAGDTVDTALSATVHQIWTSCLFAALTTMAGLLSLAFSGYSQSVNMGLLGSAGVLIGLLFTFGPGISLLRILHRGHRSAVRERPSSGRRRAGQGIATRRAVVYALVLAALSMLGLSRLTTDVQLMNMLPPDSFTRRMAQDFEEIYGGKTFLRLSLDSGKKNGVTNPLVLKSMMDIQTYAEAQPGISGTYSYASILAMINEVWQGWEPGSFVLPNPFKVGMFDTVLQTQNFPFTDALYSADRRMGYVYIRSRAMASAEYLALVHDIQAFAESQLPKGVTLVVDEGLHSLLTADKRMMAAQARTVAVTIVVIALVLLVLWRSLSLVAVALSIVVLPVMVTLGVAGALGISLNSVTFMLCAIVLGIAVDDVVHFVTYWHVKRRAMSDADALAEAIRIKGAPIVFTSVLLVGVFGVFGLTSFPPAVHFGLLSALAFALTLLAVLGILPSLLVRQPSGSRPDQSSQIS